MTDEEISDAVSIMKQRVQNVGPMQMTAERHVALFELIIDAESLLRPESKLAPRRPRAEIIADIERELRIS
jgi:hypothetical protein